MGASLLQLNPPLWVRTPLGEGLAHLAIDYGIGHNIIFLVELEAGIWKHFDTNQLEVSVNFTISLNVKPDHE